jgi:hypothetical protein
MLESTTAAHEVTPGPVNERPRARAAMRGGQTSVAERELRRFIDSVTEVFGENQTKILTEIWFDALASMDCMPEPTSPDWRLVTFVASVRLATRLIDCPNGTAMF